MMLDSEKLLELPTHTQIHDTLVFCLQQKKMTV